MNIVIENLGSSDFSGEFPDSIESFRALIHVSLKEKEVFGSELFYFTVCSPDKLSEISSETFITNTLVLDLFDWDIIRKRIEKVLIYCKSCNNWDDIKITLKGLLSPADY